MELVIKFAVAVAVVYFAGRAVMSWADKWEAEVRGNLSDRIGELDAAVRDKVMR